MKQTAESAAVAQAVERRIGNAEVTGPTPVGSCKKARFYRAFLMPQNLQFLDFGDFVCYLCAAI